jgi:serine/threonine protein kinase
MIQKDSRTALPKDFKLKEYQILDILSVRTSCIIYYARGINSRSFHIIKEYNPLGTIRKSINKLIFKDQDNQESFKLGMDSFMKNAKLLEGLEHNNIVKVTTIFTHNNLAYLVAPFLQGTNLANWSKKYEKPSRKEILMFLFLFWIA